MITYPVDISNDRFTFVSGGVPHRHREWPRADGMPIENADPGLVVMQEFRAPNPVYDPETEKLDDGQWDDDPANQVTTFSRSAIAMTEGELAIASEKKDRLNKRLALRNAIPILRDWADDAATTTVTSGNAVNVLQVTITRMGKFFDHFADLLEVQQIDK